MSESRFKDGDWRKGFINVGADGDYIFLSVALGGDAWFLPHEAKRFVTEFLNVIEEVEYRKSAG